LVKLGRTQPEQMPSGLPSKADIARYSRHVSKVPILLQKSVASVDSCQSVSQSVSQSRAPGFDSAGLDALYATITLRDALNRIWWRPGGQRCEPPQILGDGSENKFVLGTSWSTQSEPTEPQDALQVREPHLDLLALPP
jgi:hypothetical protein